MATIADLFEQARLQFQSGNLGQAELLFNQVLQGDPRHAHARHLLGVLANQTGRPEVGIALLREAIALDPSTHVFHANLGIALEMQGQLDEAAANFRQALLLNPHYVNAHYNLGKILFRQGRLEEAASCYRQALRVNPNHAEAHNNLGIILYQQGQHAQAAECFREALRCNANHADAHNNLGNTFLGWGQIEEAVKCFRQALGINPRHEAANYNLGTALQGQGKLAEAGDCYRQVIAGNPHHADAHNNLGNTFKNQGEWAQAGACYREALNIDPNNANAHNNLGITLYYQGRLDEAEKCWQHALRIDAGNKVALWNRSLLRLLQGDFERGWPDFEQRWSQPQSGTVPRTFQQPRWDGSSLEGKTILLHAEEGFGDTFHFIRYAPLVKQQGGTVLFECPSPLIKILQGCAGIDQILLTDSPLPAFDVQAALMSLPAIMKTTLANMPASIPYLYADAVLIERWQNELSRYAEFKIGIVWQGDPKVSHPEFRASDIIRSFRLAQFEPLARLPGVRLFSLQKGHGTQQLADWKSQWGIIDLADKLGDFMDTAAVMMNLDLVISADTAPVHLAGALGVPVWLAIPFVPEWRWLMDRSDSPWYPSMRLFRQQKPGDWGEVFQRIAAEVSRLEKAP